MSGMRNLADQGRFKHVQITTVVHAWNIGELDALFKLFAAEPIDSWRLTAIEPMGRALEHPELMLSPDDYRRMFAFIREKRRQGWPVHYGCCHYLGLDFEREVRDAYFICSAGIYTASIMANGDIGTCLDIERRPETVFGNVLTDDVAEVWKRGFEIFRAPDGLAGRAKMCAGCPDRRFCRGDSAHSFDYEHGCPRVCMRRDLPGFESVAAG